MNNRSWYRRVIVAGVVAAIAASGVAALAAPASADTPTVRITITDSPNTAGSGDTVTVTETVTNPNPFSILQPTAQLLSTPDAITGYSTLTSCDAGTGGSCTTLSNGYEAIFGQAISGNASATAVFVLNVDPSFTPTVVETLEGQLVATNFVSDVVPGATLTLNPKADLAVAMTGEPQAGLLSLSLKFTITVTNNGPSPLNSATINATVPDGLSVQGSGTCAATGSGAVCPIGVLPVGGKAKAVFSVPIGLLDIGIPFQFSATRATSSPPDPNPANDSASVSCLAVSVLLASCS
jgi:uncharacterized repeat protein (TIGR01451 family)